MKCVNVRRYQIVLSLGLAMVGAAGSAADAQLTIIPTFDSSITADPNATTIMNTINSVIGTYQSTFTDPITVSLQFRSMSSGLGMSSTLYGTVPYSSYRAALVADAAPGSSNDAIALAHLPSGAVNPANGNGFIAVSTANLRALGFNANPPPGQPDSTIFLNTSVMNLDRVTINPARYDLMAVAMHEIDEALGFGSALNNLSNGAPVPAGAVWGMDLYRYDQSGGRSLNTGLASQAYFSLDGPTPLARFNQTAGGDFSDWFSTGPHVPQVQDAFGTPGAIPNLNVEITALDVLGYNPIPAPGATVVLCLSGILIVRRRRG